MNEKLYDSEYLILHSASHKFVRELWEGIAKIQDANNFSEVDKLTGVKIFKNLVVACQSHESGIERKLDEYLYKTCLAFGYDNQEYKATSIYRNSIGLNKLFNTDKEFLASQEVQLNSLKISVPTKRAFFDQLHPLIEGISSTLTQVIEAKDANVKVNKVVLEIIDKAFYPDEEKQTLQEGKSK